MSLILILTMKLRALKLWKTIAIIIYVILMMVGEKKDEYSRIV